MRQRRVDNPHPAIPELAEQLRQGKLGRREFLRTVTLLGMSASAAYALAGKITGEYPLPAAQAATPRRGGRLDCRRPLATLDPKR